MTELHFPWLGLAILVPLLGAALVGRLRDWDRAWQVSNVVTGIALLCTLGAWHDFADLRVPRAGDPGNIASYFLGERFLVIDELSAPLLPMAASLYLLTSLATLRTKVRRYSFATALASEALLLATLSCAESWGVVALLALGMIPPWLELRARHKPTRVYEAHAALFVVLLVIGQAAVSSAGQRSQPTGWAMAPLLIAIFIRGGIAPFHCWMTDLFEHATFGTALLCVTPITGAYAAIRLVLPVAPDGVLQTIGLISLATSVYAAGMANIQREARRFFCYLFLSHAALVFVGLESTTPLGLTGALSVWLSVTLALAGFGLTLRALEARRGRLSLVEYHGVYEHTPALAVCFMLTGLASVGFPGTFGFVGTELLIDGVVQAYPLVGVAVVLAAALNGVAVVQAYFKLFTGTRHVSDVPLGISARERLAVISLAIIILGGGVFPQAGVASRYHAAVEILRERSHLTQTAQSGLFGNPRAFTWPFDAEGAPHAAPHSGRSNADTIPNSPRPSAGL